ncbi:MAG: phosphoglucosamine mutase [Zetaproteobacteria bacterium]|nr:MAG: phosphoglucosamine mutase [Zetaproteobacteria bacterium]
MTRRYFGTDGVRGRVNTPPMTAEFALRLGRAAGFVLTRHLAHQPHILIGKDTRLSGYMIESALCAGLTAQGMNVQLVGPIPTPAVAYLTRSLRADAGVMISASHNPAGDNGIKFFGGDGFKLPDAVELEIEGALEEPPALPPALEIGKAVRVGDARGRYIEFLKAALPRGARFDGLKVVVDCANGAAYQVAPAILRELGCTVVAIHDRPDGYNINRQCGSTHPAAMVGALRAHSADVGFALDGDGDRLIACDERGGILDGDRILATLATHQQRHGWMRGDGVVATVMSNMGLARYLEGLGLRLHRAPVGDRYVLEMMRQTGCNLGGEQSGHIIMSDCNTTGDGLLTALQLLCARADAGAPMSRLAAGLTLFPQRLWNIVLPEPIDVAAHAGVQELLARAEARLGDAGRVLVRMSGTEPKLRVMVEAEQRDLLEEVGGELVADLEAMLGGDG